MIVLSVTIATLCCSVGRLWWHASTVCYQLRTATMSPSILLILIFGPRLFSIWTSFHAISESISVFDLPAVRCRDSMLMFILELISVSFLLVGFSKPSLYRWFGSFWSPGIESFSIAVRSKFWNIQIFKPFQAISKTNRLKVICLCCPLLGLSCFRQVWWPS